MILLSSLSCEIDELDTRTYTTAMKSTCTTKQMGDACEMLVAAELTLAGVPAMKMPDNWPCYDVIAQPTDGRPPQRISVKSRTFKRGSDTYVTYSTKDEFDWLAIVLLPGQDLNHRRTFIVPRLIAEKRARRDRPTSRTANLRYWRQDEVEIHLGEFENNYTLITSGLRPQTPPTANTTSR